MSSITQHHCGKIKIAHYESLHNPKTLAGTQCSPAAAASAQNKNLPNKSDKVIKVIKLLTSVSPVRVRQNKISTLQDLHDFECNQQQQVGSSDNNNVFT